MKLNKILLILAGFFVLLLASCGEPSRPVITEKVSDSWLLFNSPEIGFQLEYPSEMSVEESDSSAHFSIWGPSQKNDTEFYDGIAITVTKSELTGETLFSLATSEFDQISELGEITAAFSPIVIDGHEGYTFSGYTVGMPQQNIYLPYGSSEALILNVLYADPSGENYKELVDKVLESFGFVDFPTINISVSSPVAGDVLGDELEISGKARVFENVVLYRLKDDLGNVLAEGFVTADSPDVGLFGPFEVVTSYEEPQSNGGLLEVYTQSAMDGSEIEKVLTEVEFPN